MKEPPLRIRVGQDKEGFWTCREARAGADVAYINEDKATVAIRNETLHQLKNNIMSSHVKIPKKYIDEIYELIEDLKCS